MPLNVHLSPSTEKKERGHLREIHKVTWKLKKALQSGNKSESLPKYNGNPINRRLTTVYKRILSCTFFLKLQRTLRIAIMWLEDMTQEFWNRLIILRKTWEDKETQPCSLKQTTQLNQVLSSKYPLTLFVKR